MPIVVLADARDQTVGYGVVGEARPDVATSIAGAPVNSGWRGYVVHSAGGVRAFLYTQQHFCPLAGNTALVAP
jgi:hypothetical protein